MKTKHFFLAVAFLLVMAGACGIALADSAKIFFVISDKDTGKSGGDEIKALETLIAKHCMEAGYEIVTSEELSPSSSSWLGADDVASALGGDMEKTRKAAAFHNANLIFKASLKTDFTDVEVYERKMKKAVSSVSCRLITTSDGKVVDINSVQGQGNGNTPEDARHFSLRKMAEEISKTLKKKVPVQLSESDQERLTLYKKTFASGTRVAVAPPPRVTEEKPGYKPPKSSLKPDPKPVPAPVISTQPDKKPAVKLFILTAPKFY